VITKTCTKCIKTKEISEFYAKGIDRFDSQCKDCKKIKRQGTIKRNAIMATRASHVTVDMVRPDIDAFAQCLVALLKEKNDGIN
jgi:hypothetical protein